MARSDKTDISTWPWEPADQDDILAGTKSPKTYFLGNWEHAKEYINDLLAAFRTSGGHTHTGVDGDGPKLTPNTALNAWTNNTYLQAKTSAGVDTSILGIAADDDVQMGNASLGLDLLGNAIESLPPLSNSVYLQAKDSGGTPRNVIGVDGSNTAQIGSDALSGIVLNIGSASAYPSSQQVSIYDNATRTIFRSGRSRFDFLRQDAAGWADVYVGVLTGTGVNIDSGTLYVDATNNRVGVNTSSPAYALDVNGVMRMRNYGALGANATPVDTAGLIVDNAYTGTLDNYGAIVRARKTTAGSTNMNGVGISPVVDTVTVGKFEAIQINNPSLTNGGTISNVYALGVGSSYTQTTVGAAGGASALPATPSGYIRVYVNGVPGVVPWYNAA